MNEIIQNLEADATNGEENFCYISENKLNALKELSKRENEQLKNKQDVIDKIKKYIENEMILDFYDNEIPIDVIIYKLLDILKGSGINDNR